MFRIENTPSINYIWVGPPSPSQKKETSVGLEEKNHDLIGPIKMSQLNNSNRIVFWCLDAHVASYKKKFNGIKIEVRSIEKYIGEQKSHSNGIQAATAEKMEEILKRSLTKTLLNGEEVGDKVRDRVTVKDAFSLFLHATKNEAMYTLDTNVTPLGNQIFSLPYDEHFRLPLMTSSECNCWALYSSEPNKNIPQSGFNGYYRIWKNEALSEFNQFGYTTNYEGILFKAIMTPLDEAGFKFKGREKPWETSSSEIYTKERKIDDSAIVTISEIGIKKEYYNTHVIDQIKVQKSTQYNNSSQYQQNLDSDDELDSDEKLIGYLGGNNDSKERKFTLSSASIKKENPYYKNNNIDSKETTIDRETYLNAIDVIKTHIEKHAWQLSPGPMGMFAGGKNIILSNKSITVPTSVYTQWSLIDNWYKDPSNEQPQELFDKIVKIGADEANKNEKKQQDSFLGLGKRQADTAIYLNFFKDSPSPQQCIEKFDSIPEVKKYISIKD